MTTKPSNSPWADEPYKLITTPLKYKDVKSHSAVHCASEMAYAHNCLLRGLNAILQQAPHIPSADQEGYVKQDVKDLLFIVVAWVKTVNHHHSVEEEVMFPMIEKMSGQPGLLSGPLHQHEEFHDSLVKLGEYATENRKTPAEYRWSAMKPILDALGPPLVQHLRDEIDVFLSFDRFDDKGLRECFDAAEKVATGQRKIAFLYDIFPLVLATCDKTYEGGNSFPPLPAFMPYAIKYWFSRYNRSAWRFVPCKFWGQPKPLEMLPENRNK